MEAGERDSGLISPRVILYQVCHRGKWRLDRERKQEGRGKGGRGKMKRKEAWRVEVGVRHKYSPITSQAQLLGGT